MWIVNFAKLLADDLEKIFLIHYQMANNLREMVDLIKIDIKNFFSRDDILTKQNLLRRYFIYWSFGLLLYFFLNLLVPLNDGAYLITFSAVTFAFYIILSLNLHFLFFAIAGNVVIYFFDEPFGIAPVFHTVVSAVLLIMYLISYHHRWMKSKDEGRER